MGMLYLSLYIIRVPPRGMPIIAFELKRVQSYDFFLEPPNISESFLEIFVLIYA